MLVAAAVYFLVIVPFNAVTMQGSKVIGKVMEHHARDVEDALSRLEHSEKEALANLLRKLGHGADARSAGASSIVREEQAKAVGEAHPT